jgi:hypothetical protein
MPILWIFCRVTPVASMGTTMRLLFLCTGPSLVLASRQHQSAFMPLVIHILRAVDDVVAAVLARGGLHRGDVGAAAGSLTPMQPTMSPAIEGARNSRLSSSVPKRASAGVHMSVCTPMAMGTPPQFVAPSASAITME